MNNKYHQDDDSAGMNPVGIGSVFLKYQSLLKRYISRFIRQPEDIDPPPK